MADPQRWDLLAEHVVRRRLELGYSNQQLFAHASGISISIVGRIERGIYRPGRSVEVLVKLQNGLRWDVGSVKSILDGGHPTPLPTSRLA